VTPQHVLHPLKLEELNFQTNQVMSANQGFVKSGLLRGTPMTYKHDTERLTRFQGIKSQTAYKIYCQRSDKKVSQIDYFRLNLGYGRNAYNDWAVRAVRY